ncbi:hypothetical protein BLN97_42360 [Bradyrhizobium elkanii]|nr:hypothetical protein BLN97_42360 [Bradyrhizobium elkanii]
MRYKVSLDESWRRIVPIRRRPYWNTATQRMRCVPPAFATQFFSDRHQYAVNRRSAHRQKLGADLGGKIEVAMPIHRLNQRRH